MHDQDIGVDDYRILTYARLIDPEVWPRDEDPEVGPLTANRLRRSLEGAYRIASHQGDLVDRSDIVGRLAGELGLDDPLPVLALPGALAPSEAADLVAILLSGGSSTSDEPFTTPLHLQPQEEAEGDEGLQDHDEPAPEDTMDDVDPDHDPEAGISHVGDPDEGQHYEELP